MVERSKALGIELCLWFNPSKDDSYAHWRDDADALIGLYREYGIRTFKIDGVMIPDKRADLNLRGMFERVMDATGGQAVFNLDVTAGRRWGYHYGNEYGNIFLENRYTDWSNYYPHWTLRNLWMLSRYVPPQNLQIEFLNRWRNADRYPADDPLAPGRVPVRLLLCDHDDGAAAGLVRGDRPAGGGLRHRAAHSDLPRAPGAHPRRADLPHRRGTVGHELDRLPVVARAMRAI